MRSMFGTEVSNMINDFAFSGLSDVCTEHTTGLHPVFTDYAPSGLNAPNE
jgi:hypothetical protein